MKASKIICSFPRGNDCVIYCKLSSYSLDKVARYAQREGLPISQFVLKSVFAYMQWMDEKPMEGGLDCEDQETDCY